MRICVKCHEVVSDTGVCSNCGYASTSVPPIEHTEDSPIGPLRPGTWPSWAWSTWANLTLLLCVLGILLIGLSIVGPLISGYLDDSDMLHMLLLGLLPISVALLILIQRTCDIQRLGMLPPQPRTRDDTDR